MATFSQYKDELKTCPYNPGHKVASRRLQQHIIKCAKDPKNPVLKDCPFNALHKISPQDYEQHILTCRDSRQIIREIEESRTVANHNIAAPAVIHRTQDPTSFENWDEEVDKEKAKNYVVPGLEQEDDGECKDSKEEKPFRIKTPIEIQAMKPAQRKQYYKLLVERTKERQKVAESVNETEQAEASVNHSLTNAKSCASINVKLETKDNEVRKPKTVPFTGIGRGLPLTSTRRPIERTVGQVAQHSSVNESADISRNSNTGGSIKREREEEPLLLSKRHSPEIPF